MRQGFTLIELLVVMVIIVVIMGLVMPMGSKLLNSFEKQAQKIEDEHSLQISKAYAFIEATPKDINLSFGNYHISLKGVISEISNDNR